MRDHRHEFERRGVRVAAIAQGTGADARRFCGPLKTGFPCLGDPGRESYRAFGLGRAGWYGMIVKPFLEDPKLAWQRVRAADMQGAALPSSDVKQLGGVAILERGGLVRWLHRAKRTDDIPPMSEVVAELDRQRGRS